MLGLRLIIFDVDGTLIDSQVLIVASMHDGFAAVQRPSPERADILSIVGLSLDVAIAQLDPGLSASQVEAVCTAYKLSFSKRRREMGGEAAVPLYSGVRALLESLHLDENTLLGVATGKARRGLDHVIESQ